MACNGEDFDVAERLVIGSLNIHVLLLRRVVRKRLPFSQDRVEKLLAGCSRERERKRDEIRTSSDLRTSLEASRSTGSGCLSHAGCWQFQSRTGTLLLSEILREPAWAAVYCGTRYLSTEMLRVEDDFVLQRVRRSHSPEPPIDSGIENNHHCAQQQLNAPCQFPRVEDRHQIVCDEI
jgi:hypothetical protein